MPGFDAERAALDRDLTCGPACDPDSCTWHDFRKRYARAEDDFDAAADRYHEGGWDALGIAPDPRDFLNGSPY